MKGAAGYAKYLDFARGLAKVAEAEILPLYQNCAARLKADGSEVTDADRNAERAVRARIEKTYPEHGILGEEYGSSSDNRSRQWVIDPIDGTAWFTLGMPTFGTLIALVEAGDPVLGVVHFPALGETVYAARGLGCHFQPRTGPSRRVRVDPVQALEGAVASASGVHSSDVSCGAGQTPYRLSALIRGVKKFRFCTDCLQHALVCRGRVHIALDPIMQPWDLAAIVPCVEEAGGVVGNLQGRRDGILQGGSLLSAATPELHRRALEALQPPAPVFQ